MIFDGIRPTRTITVSPLESIQAAINAATPGTRIEVYGTHTENVAFNAAVPTTPTAPIWLAGMDGAKIIGLDKSKGVINGWKCSNYIVSDLGVEDSFRGIYFGADDTKRGSNILVLRNRITGMREDGVKISHITNCDVVANTISKCGPDGECIDAGVNCWNVWIAYNETFDHTGTANLISAKSGSRDVVIEHNDVHDGKSDGICLGGQGVGAGAYTYQVLRCIVRKNKVRRCAENPILAKGAVDSLIEDNYSESLTYNPNMVVSYGTHNGVQLHSKNVEITRSTLIGRTEIRVNAPSTANIHDNYLNPNPVTWNFPVGPSALPAEEDPAVIAELQVKVATLEAELANAVEAYDGEKGRREQAEQEIATVKGLVAALVAYGAAQ